MGVWGEGRGSWCQLANDYRENFSLFAAHTRTHTHTLTGALAAGLALGHVVEDLLHRAAVRERAGLVLSSAHGVLPLPPLALVCVQQQHQLLLDQLPLLRVGCPVLASRGVQGI